MLQHGRAGAYLIDLQRSEVHDFSCTVIAWDGEYTIAPQHLKSKDYSDAECEEMRGCAISLRHSFAYRISRLYSLDMESAVRAVLKSLGELRRPYLTELEEKLLGVLEGEYEASTYYA